MKRIRSLLVALAISTTPAMAQLEMLQDVLERLGGADIQANGSVSFDKQSLLWTGGIHFKSDTMEAFADEARYNLESEELEITGDVSIYKDGMLYRGEKAIYSTRTNQLDASHMRSSLEPQAPIWFTAGKLDSEMKELDLIKASDVELTTHDDEDPNFHLGAKEVKIYPDDRVVFKNLKAYVGKTPIFWLPYLSQPLDEEQGYIFVPGYRSNLGPFLLNQYGTTIGDHSVIKYKLDIYSMRGVAVGADVLSRRFKNEENFGKFKFYWINDTSPDEGIGRESRANVDANRYRVNLQHRVYLPGPQESSLYVDVDLNKLSDQFFYEDFFPWEFRDDPQPDNIINIVKQHDRGELSLLGRFHLNDFFGSDSRSPELALDLVRQPVGNFGLYYNGTSSFGVLEDHLAEDVKASLTDNVRNLEKLLAADEGAEVTDADGKVITLDDFASLRGRKQDGKKLTREVADDLLSELRAKVNESKFNRFHSYHELNYPVTVAGGVTINPKIGAGFTNYSSIHGPKPLDTSRFILSTGLDLSTKFSKVYDDVDNRSLGLKGLRHVIQPYLNWSFVNADDNGKEFRGIDRLVQSTQSRPLDVSNWTAIDSLNDWNIVRLGVYNRFQTKRDDRTFTWLQTNSYFDTFLEDPEFNRDFSNLHNDIEWQPLPWARLSLGTQIPVFGEEQDFTELNSRLYFMPNANWEFAIGHRSLKDHPLFENSDLIDFHSYWRINDNWGVSVYERYEIEDSTLELQQYSIHRDLSSWAAALGAVIRDNRGQTDYGIIFSLTLKEFPGVRIPIDFDPSGGPGSAQPKR